MQLEMGSLTVGVSVASRTEQTAGYLTVREPTFPVAPATKTRSCSFAGVVAAADA
jgi:hypothetical protein